MTRLFFAFAALSGFVAVALGAFGAHGLKPRLSPSMMSAFETAVQYQFYHTLAILGLALLMERLGEKPLLLTAGYFFMGGIVLFSGSLYLLALGGPRWLGPITPLGGVTFLLAWSSLFIAFLRSRF